MAVIDASLNQLQLSSENCDQLNDPNLGAMQPFARPFSPKVLRSRLLGVRKVGGFRHS